MKIHERVESHHSFVSLWIIGALLVLGGLVYSYIDAHPEGVISAQAEGDVRTLIAAFGNQLNSVSIQSPEAPADIASAYGPYVSEALLNAWIAEPLSAPGRVTSSPWPDHLETDTVVRAEDGTYTVTGRIMLVDSAGDAGSIPVVLTVSDASGRFLITEYQEEDVSEQIVPESETANLSVALGESVSAHGVTLTPRSIDEDSRCPEDVQCIQAGQLLVSVEVRDAAGSDTVPFMLGGPAVTTETASIRFAEAMPARVSSAPLRDEAYRFVFHIDAR